MMTDSGNVHDIKMPCTNITGRFNATAAQHYGLLQTFSNLYADVNIYRDFARQSLHAVDNINMQMFIMLNPPWQPRSISRETFCHFSWQFLASGHQLLLYDLLCTTSAVTRGRRWKRQSPKLITIWRHFMDGIPLKTTWHSYTVLLERYNHSF